MTSFLTRASHAIFSLDCTLDFYYYLGIVFTKEKMNKKQKVLLIIWAILLIVVGIFWIGAGSQYNRISGEYIWELNGLVGRFLIISAPAAILYFAFKKQ